MTRFSVVFTVSFIVGLVLTLLVQSLLSLIFWLSVGYLALCLVDLLMGLGQRACLLRERVRSTIRTWIFGRRYSGPNVVLFR